MSVAQTYLVHLVDLKVSEQARIHPCVLNLVDGPGTTVDGLYAHSSHQSLHTLSVDRVSLTSEPSRHLP